MHHLVVRQQRRRKYQNGIIVRSRLNNTFDVEYELDGEVEEQIPPVFLRPDDHTIVSRGMCRKDQQLYDCSKFMPGDRVSAYRGSSHFDNLLEPRPTEIPGGQDTPEKRSFKSGTMSGPSRQMLLEKAVFTTPKDQGYSNTEFHTDLVIDELGGGLGNTLKDIQIGDLLTEIDGEALVEVTPSGLAALLRSKKGQYMRWVVRRQVMKILLAQTTAGTGAMLKTLKMNKTAVVLPEELTEKATEPRKIEVRTKHSSEVMLKSTTDMLKDLQANVNNLGKELREMKKTIDSQQHHAAEPQQDEPSQERDQQQYMAGYMAALAASMESNEEDPDKKVFLKNVVHMFS